MFRDSRDFGDFKNTYDLPYDCFWDGTDDFVETYVESQTGGLISAINNDVIAIMPNGVIIRYDFLTDGNIEEWIHKMYQQAYPN